MDAKAMRRALLEKKIGDFSAISADELFLMACQAEETMEAVGSHDVAWAHFYHARQAYLDAAAIRELEGRADA